MRVVAAVQFIVEMAPLIYNWFHGSPVFLLLFWSRKSGIWIIGIWSHVWHWTFRLEEELSSDHIFSLFKTFPKGLTVICPLPWLLVSLSVFVLCLPVSWFFLWAIWPTSTSRVRVVLESKTQEEAWWGEKVRLVTGLLFGPSFGNQLRPSRVIFPPLPSPCPMQKLSPKA